MPNPKTPQDNASKNPKAEASKPKAPRAARQPRERAPEAERQLKEISETLSQLKNNLQHPATEAGPKGIPARTVDAVQRRTKALANNANKDHFKAGTFAAGTFAASGIDELQVQSALNVRVPMSSFEDAAAVLQMVSLRPEECRLPPRIGYPGSSTVLRSVASGQYTVPNSGTGGFTQGDTILLVTPVSAATKGAALVAVSQSNSYMKVLKYFSDPRDTERVGHADLVQFVSLQLSAASTLTGTTAAITGMTIQMGETVVGPAALLAGKMDLATVSRHAPIALTGQAVHTLQIFTADRPVEDIIRLNPYDDPNPAIIALANNGGSNADQQTCGYPMPSRHFAIAASARDQSTAINAGFDPAIAAQWGTFVIFTSATIWRLSANTDSRRHVLFGGFRLTGGLNFDSGAPTKVTISIQFDTGDGAVAAYNVDVPADSGGYVNLSFDSRGYNGLAQQNGKWIRDIVISAVGSPTTNLILDPVYDATNRISIEFYEVPANTTYAVASLTGAIPGYVLTARSVTQTEVMIDPTSISATYMEPCNILPYHPFFFPTLVRLHCCSMNGESVFSAASLQSTAAKVLRLGGRAGRLLAPMAGRNSGIITGLSDLAIAAGQQMRAASFGAGPSLPPMPEYFFPAVSREHYVIAPITVSKVTDPEIKRAFPRSRLGLPDVFDGRSHSLAYLLACLSEAGFPTCPGTYSGEVRSVTPRYSGEKLVDVSFTLLPVDLAPEKIAAAGTSGLIGYFATGWHNGIRASPPSPADFFPPSVKVVAEASEAGLPQPAIRIRAFLSTTATPGSRGKKAADHKPPPIGKVVDDIYAFAERGARECCSSVVIVPDGNYWYIRNAGVAKTPYFESGKPVLFRIPGDEDLMSSVRAKLQCLTRDKPSHSRTSLYAPLVSEHGSFLASIVRSEDPLVISDKKIYYRPDHPEVAGGSDSFACVLAQIQEHGIPVSPGAYTGIVASFGYKIKRGKIAEIVLALEPASDWDEKVRASTLAAARLRGYMEDGWHDSYKRRLPEPDFLDVFPTAIAAEAVTVNVQPEGRRLLAATITIFN